jgi:phage shock protein A
LQKVKPVSLAETRFTENVNAWEREVRFLQNRLEQLKERKEKVSERRQGAFSQQQLKQIYDHMAKTMEYLTKGTEKIEQLEARISQDDRVKQAGMEDEFREMDIASPTRRRK